MTPSQSRINFAKYGRHNASEDAAAAAGAVAVSAALPANIYCDLVTTLSAKCIQERSAALHRYTLNTEHSDNSASALNYCVLLLLL